MDGLSPYIFSRFSEVKSFKNPLKGFSHSSIESKAEKRKKIWFGYHDCYRYTDTYISIIVITVYIFFWGHDYEILERMMMMIFVMSLQAPKIVGLVVMMNQL